MYERFVTNVRITERWIEVNKILLIALPLYRPNCTGNTITSVGEDRVVTLDATSMRETTKTVPENKGRGKVKKDSLQIPVPVDSPNTDPGVLTPGDVCLPGFVSPSRTEPPENGSGVSTLSQRPAQLNISDSTLKSSRARVPSGKQATTAVVHIPETQKLQYLMPPEPHPPFVKPHRANDSGVESCESESGTKIGSTQEPQKPIVFTFEVPFALVQQRYDQPHLVVFDSEENSKDETQKTSGAESKESVVTVGSRGAETRSKERRYCDGCTLTIVLIVLIVVGNIIGAVYVYHKYNMISSSLPATISPVLTTLRTTSEVDLQLDQPPTSAAEQTDDTISVRLASTVTSADFR